MKKLAALVAVLVVACSALWAQGPTVWVASPWEHVLRSTAPGPVRSVHISAARNEYEPFRIIVHAGATALKNINVVAKPLIGAKGKIPAGNIRLFREHYIHIFEPSYRSTAPPGWYPDALIPFVDPLDGSPLSGARFDAVPFDVPAGQNQGVWADVYVPRDAPAGSYRGTVVVLAGNKVLARVPVTLTVYDFSLPDTFAMRSNFGSLGGIAKKLGLDINSSEYRRVEDLYIDTLLEHRCIPTSLGNIWPRWTEEGGIDDSASGERLRTMVEERHVNALPIPFAYRNDPPKCKRYLHDLAAYLRAKGYLDLAYIYLHDEPNSAEEYELVRRQAALIHEADPGIKRLCTEQTVTSNPDWGTLYGSVDIWCPLWGLYDEESARQRQALGEEIWSYTALCQRDEKNPFWQIDFPPIVYRVPFWVSWHYDLKGILYWCTVYWNYDDVWTAPHFRDMFWGEGMLLYPGTDAGIAGPVPSIRLKLIREGMEDFEYMHLAARKAGRGLVDAIVDKLARAFTDWNHDPAAYFQAREQLARLIAD